MFELIKSLWKQETLLVDEYRAKGNKVIRPSTILIGLVGLFYVLSPIDIIPELLVKPPIFGLIDDLLIVTVVGVFIYSDLGGMLSNAIEQRIQDVGIPKSKEDTEKALVHLEHKRERHTSDVHATDSSVVTSNPEVGISRTDIDSDRDASDDGTDDFKITSCMAELGVGDRIKGADNNNSSGESGDDGDEL